MSFQDDFSTTDLPAACLRFQRLWDQKLDAETLSPEEEDYLETHPACCASCKAYAAEMADIIRTLEHLAPLPVPADLTDRIMQRIQRPVPFRRPAYIAIAASVLAVVVSTSVFSSWKQPTAKAPTTHTVAALPTSAQPAEPVGTPKSAPASSGMQPAQQSAYIIKTSGSRRTKGATAPAKETVHADPTVQKELIALNPEEAFTPEDIQESSQEETQADLLAQWVPLEAGQEPQPSEDAEDPMGGGAQDDVDPMTNWVGF